MDNIISKLNECKSLDELFSLWKSVHRNEQDYEKCTVTGMEKDSFIADGYICEENYLKSKCKILFILKESNLVNYKNEDDPSQRQQIWFYRNYVLGHTSVLNRPKQQEKIGRMASYILNGNKTPTLSEIQESLGQCCFMNLNKRGGNNFTDNVKFSNYVEKYRSFILKQISVLDPDYIVFLGNCYGRDMIKQFAFENEINYIAMWHTAYRMSRVKRNANPIYSFGDKNVDCYMRRFFDITKEFN